MEAFAQAQLGNELAARRALRHSEELFKRLHQEDSVFGFTERRQLFYRGRALLRIGDMTEARTALNDALSSYPLDVVGDPAVLRLDLAERLVTEGDPLQAAELAISVLSDLHPEHRAALFTDAGRRVLAAVSALGAPPFCSGAARRANGYGDADERDALQTVNIQIRSHRNAR